jgi:hypothetical protein
MLLKELHEFRPNTQINVNSFNLNDLHANLI